MFFCMWDCDIGVLVVFEKFDVFVIIVLDEGN